MGRKPSIDRETGRRLLEAYQRLGSKRAAAVEIGVSIGAAMRFFDETPRAVAAVISTPTAQPSPQQEMIAQAGASLFETRAALEENYQRALALVSKLERGMTVRADDGGHETPVSPTVLVAALGEVRQHITTGMKYFQLLLSVDETRAFQRAVLEAIGEADEPTRQRIIAKLQDRRSLDLTL